MATSYLRNPPSTDAASAVRAGDEVRAKLEKANLDDSDLGEAIAWARANPAALAPDE